MGLCVSKTQADNTSAADKPTKKEESKPVEEQKTEAKAEDKKVEEKKPEEKKEEKKPEEKKEEKKPEENKEEKKPEEDKKPVEEKKPEAAAAAPVASSEDLPPYTNRPEDLEGVTAASGTFVKKTWEAGVSPDLSGVQLTGEIVTDGKVSFDKAALTVEGVFPTRDEEVAQLQKAIDLKKDAAAATGKANELHEEHNKLFESGDKDGAKAKLAESKTFRAKAQEIHQESFDLAYAGAMSMAIKAVFSKYPSIDYHVFLVDPYEKSYLVAIDMMKKYGKYGRKDFMVIPGEGQHSGAKGPAIRPHFEKWMEDNKIGNEKITSGSYAIILADVKP